MHIAIFVMNICIKNNIYKFAALIRGRLLFPLTHDPCGAYSRAATIRSAAFIRGNAVFILDVYRINTPANIIYKLKNTKLETKTILNIMVFVIIP